MSINNTKKTLTNIIIMAIQLNDGARGLQLIEDLFDYLSNKIIKKEKLLFQEFDLRQIDNTIPVESLMTFCSNIIDTAVDEIEKKLPPQNEWNMLFGQQFELVEKHKYLLRMKEIGWHNLKNSIMNIKINTK